MFVEKIILKNVFLSITILFVESVKEIYDFKYYILLGFERPYCVRHILLLNANFNTIWLYHRCKCILVEYEKSEYSSKPTGHAANYR